MQQLRRGFVIVGLIAFSGTTHATVQSADAKTALRSFTEQVEREWPGDAHQQAITVKSLRLLADTVRAVAAARHQLTPEILTVLDRLRTETSRFESGKPEDASQSTQMRHVLTTATDLMARVAGPGSGSAPVSSRLAALRRAIEGLDRGQRLRRQPDVLERYFHQAAELLGQIDATPTPAQAGLIARP